MMDETFEHNRKSKNYEMGQIKSIKIANITETISPFLIVIIFIILTTAIAMGISIGMG